MQNSLPFPAKNAEAGHNPKVAIPKLDRHEDPKPASSEKLRVLKACTNCRKRKVRCTGERPQCKSCKESDLTCTYEQARKDRLKTATEQNHVLVSLLKDLSLRVDDKDKKRINATLEGIPNDVTNAAKTKSTKALGKRPSTTSASDEEHGETEVPASVGSNEDLDLLDEDLLRDREARETGFLGQISEVQWLRSLQRRMGSPDGEDSLGQYGPPGASHDASIQRVNAMHKRRNSKNLLHVTDSNFYLDSQNIEVEAMVDPYELPPLEAAENLFTCYMDTVHSWFPILPQEFEEQFHKYYNSVNLQRTFQVPDKWQAVLNLIFAIGARYSHLTRASWRGDERDHLLYMTRAVRMLGVKDITKMISGPDLLWIQATGLLSLYYMVIGHINKAWAIVGISIRSALAVGLHLRNEDPTTPPNKKETLLHTWWSLHSIECLLSAITGRPFVIANEDCTVPLPSSQKEHSGDTTRHDRPRGNEAPPTTNNASFESTNSTTVSAPIESFMAAHIKMNLTTRTVLTRLYSARTANSTWEEIQGVIKSLLKETSEWAAVALSGDLGYANANLEPTARHERLLLEFHYYSTKILITRPCLCRLDRHIKDQSESSDNFNQQMAETCVKAAQSLTHLLPDQPDPVYLYQNGPWWSIVHHIMQAMVVFLLETSYQCSHLKTQNNDDVSKSIKKLVRWLQCMRSDNDIADQAYKVVTDILKSGKLPVEDNIDSMIVEDEPDLDREQPYPSYPTSTQGLDAEIAFTQAEQHTDYYPGPVGNFDALSDPYFSLDQFQMPEIYENLFMTSFDQPNPLFPTMEDILMGEDEAAMQHPYPHEQE